MNPDMIMLAWIIYKIGTDYGNLIFWNVMTYMLHWGIKR